MHLLNTSTYKIHEFQGDDIPPYAILSHRWDDEELTFSDMQDKRNHKKPGFTKIRRSCAQAVLDRWQYVWIDSCCIDKTSSAELSEAINSMFQWYKDAQVCYAYLSDVPKTDEDPSSPISAFRASKWFTRGWTLQELLAPSSVIFFNKDWIEIGTKSSLYDTITSITGISPLGNYMQACVAQKMSWASKRETTKMEDMAYCLMGLFGVNMPPLYGEGRNAFRRLQLEILSRSDDESIFAWKGQLNFGGLLATHPSAFRDSGAVKVLNAQARPPYSMTNKGIRIETPLIPYDEGAKRLIIGEDLNPMYLAPLNCYQQHPYNVLSLLLERVNGSIFVRRSRFLILRNGLDPFVGQEIPAQVVYVNQPSYTSFAVKNRPKYVFWVEIQSLLKSRFSISQREVEESRWNHGAWQANLDELKFTLDINRILDTYPWGALMFENDASDRFVLILDLDGSFNPGVNILIPPRGGATLKDLVTSFYNGQGENERHIRHDRVHRILKRDLSISVSLKKTLKRNELLNLVDITVGKT